MRKYYCPMSKGLNFDEFIVRKDGNNILLIFEPFNVLGNDLTLYKEIAKRVGMIESVIYMTYNIFSHIENDKYMLCVRAEQTDIHKIIGDVKDWFDNELYYRISNIVHLMNELELVRDIEKTIKNKRSKNA